MKDTRTVLDNVRAVIPGDAPLLVVYIGKHGELQCAQANCDQHKLQQIVSSLQMNMMSPNLGIARKK